MSQKPQSNSSANLQAVHLLIAVIATIIITVFTLDFHGYIRHSSADDTLITGSYRAILIEAGQEYRMSHKDSGKRARCVQGYLALESISSGQAAGFLVDDKNRGIHCAQ